MKLRCFPPKRQKGFSALTMPAPLVQRLPAPPANETTATIPAASASLPISWYFGSTPPVESNRSSRLDVGDAAGDGKAILRQSHAAVAQVRLDLLMLHAVKSVGFQQRIEALRARRLSAALCGIRCSKTCCTIPWNSGTVWQAAVKCSSSARRAARKQAGFHAQKRRHGHLVIARRHQRLHRLPEARPACPVR